MMAVRILFPNLSRWRRLIPAAGALAIALAAVPAMGDDGESPPATETAVAADPVSPSAPPETVVSADPVSPPGHPEPVAPSDPPETVLLAQSHKSGAAQFQAGCEECNPPKRFWPAFGELMAVQFIPWSINHFARDAEWADISPKTWWTNMSNPWLWDNNKFLNNQFSHPYHGNLYFNAGRANGYN